MGEHWLCKPGVRGSTPLGSTFFFFLAAFVFCHRVRRWRVRWSSSISCARRANSHFKTSNLINLSNSSNLARTFFVVARIAKPQAAKLMFSHHVLIKILGFRPKGTSFIFKNIEKLPKGTSFCEGDKKKGGGWKGDGGRNLNNDARTGSADSRPVH
jgi:hypothetical protein